MNERTQRKRKCPFTNMAARSRELALRAGRAWGRGLREPSGTAPPCVPPAPRLIPDWSGSSAAAQRPRRRATPGARHFRRVWAVSRGRQHCTSGRLRSRRVQGCSGGRRWLPWGLRRRGQRGPPGLSPEPASLSTGPSGCAAEALSASPLQPLGRARRCF